MYCLVRAFFLIGDSNLIVSCKDSEEETGKLYISSYKTANFMPWFFSGCCNNGPWQKLLKAEGVYSVSQLMAQSVVVGRSTWQAQRSWSHFMLSQKT